MPLVWPKAVNDPPVKPAPQLRTSDGTFAFPNPIAEPGKLKVVR